MVSRIQLHDQRYTVEIEPQHGVLERIEDRIGGCELIAEPRLAESFRLLLPLPDMQANYILGKDQLLSSFTRSRAGVELVWRGPLRNERGEFALDVTLWITLVDGAVQFRCRVVNRTPHKLAEVWYGIIGGMRGLGRDGERRQTEALVPRGNSQWVQPLFRDFGNTRGQALGITGGEHSFFYPGDLSMPWTSLYHRGLNRALYFAALEEVPRVKVLRLALDPGLGERRPDGNWPRPEEVGHLPCGLTINWTHVPYTPPGSTFEGATLVLKCHEGSWRESAALYRKWFTSHFPSKLRRPSWMRRTTATLDTMFLLPEDNVNVRFKGIPRWAEAAARYGLKHVMISGWHVGGHDRGYPQYEPDPRLGTWQELRSGIRACHELGLRVSFFVNCQPIDLTTAWYRRELHKYRILDPYGQQYFIVNYWGMGTLSARTRFFTARPFTEMNPAYPVVRRLLIRQMRRLVEIGADGLHIDKFFQTPLDFNRRLKGTSPDRAHHDGILKFVEELVAACRRVNPHFCFSFEGIWDRLVPYSDTSWWGPEDSVLREVFPLRVLTAGVEQPYDFNKINHAVLTGDHLLIGPANYTRGMDYEPMKPLFEYAAQVTRIRAELLDLLSLGRKIDGSHGLLRKEPSAIRVSGPFARNANAVWSVFRARRSGRRAIVLANLGTRPLHASGVQFVEHPARRCRIYQPLKGTRSEEMPVSLHVPPERVAFIVEP